MLEDSHGLSPRYIRRGEVIITIRINPIATGMVRIESRAPHTTKIIMLNDKYAKFFLNMPIDCLAFIRNPIPKSNNVDTKNRAIIKKVGCVLTKLASVKSPPP